jgi:hypothetical protein
MQHRGLETSLIKGGVERRAYRQMRSSPPAACWISLGGSAPEKS